MRHSVDTLRWRPRLAAMMLLLAACKGSPTTSGGDNIANITVSGAPQPITVGGTVQLSAVAMDATGATVSATFTWSSDHATVASVSSNGTVTAKAAGSATISASAGGKSGTLMVTVNNATPTLTSIAPASAAAGSAATMLTATGTEFTATSVIQWNGSALPTSYVSATQLTTTIPGSDLAGAGTAQVTVMTPTPGGGTSDPQPFVVNATPNPAPVLTALQPDTVNAGNAAFTLTLAGTNFVAGSTVQWNGQARPTTYVSATQLTAQISASDVATAGTVPVTVSTPAPGGGTSAPMTLVITGASSMATAIAMGSDFACALGVSGTAYCWGGTDSLQLVTLTTGGNARPLAQIAIGPEGLGGWGCGVDLASHADCSAGNFRSEGSGWTTMTFSKVTAGAFTACGIATDQTAWCWGSEDAGELGNGISGSFDAGATPAAVVGGLHYQAMASGDSFTCAVTTSTVTQCWGVLPGSTMEADVPTVVTGAPAFVSLAAGGAQICGLTAAGAAYCWGTLPAGDGITTNVTTPVAVGGGVQFSSLAVGDTSMICGLTPAHATYCWGDGTVPLGDGTYAGSAVPVLVSAAPSFISIAASARNACGIAAAGDIWCWGERDYGNIGNGTVGYVAVPTPVSTGPALPSLVAGNHFTCGLSATHQAYCWGSNAAGTLGDGTRTDRNTPVAVTGGLAFTQLADNAQSHVCALTATGAAYCWGSDSTGELGNGSMTPQVTSPVAVSGGLAFKQISAGRGTCGVTTSGAGYCWGNSATLGTGASSPSDVPVLVSGGYTWSAIAVGDGHACGITTTGVGYCWGIDVSLGDGDVLTDHLQPYPVSGSLTFASIASSGSTTCGVTTSGAGYCWGITDQTGQFINDVPTLVPGGLTWTSLRPGTVDCGTTSSGLYCWGTNDVGQVGQSTTTFEFSNPTPIAIGQVSAYAISTGLDDAVCATPASGATVCWGDNRRGALGIGTFGEARTPEMATGGVLIRANIRRR